MKIVFKMMLVALFAMGAIAMVSCKKDEDKSSQDTPAATLANTTWDYNDGLTIPGYGTIQMSMELAFTNATEFTMATRVMSLDTTASGTYTFNGSTGSLHANGTEASEDIPFSMVDATHLSVNVPGESFGQTGTIPVVFTKR